jgi:hypothetical protein
MIENRSEGEELNETGGRSCTRANQIFQQGSIDAQYDTLIESNWFNKNEEGTTNWEHWTRETLRWRFGRGNHFITNLELNENAGKSYGVTTNCAKKNSWNNGKKGLNDGNRMTKGKPISSSSVMDFRKTASFDSTDRENWQRMQEKQGGEYRERKQLQTRFHHMCKSRSTREIELRGQALYIAEETDWKSGYSSELKAKWEFAWRTKRISERDDRNTQEEGT